MLSIKKIKSAESASNYFRKDDYYAKDSPEAERESSWWGKGAATLELSGVVTKEQFSSLLQGNLPDGTQLGRVLSDGERQHAPGWDLTFSAPKSVSILAEIGGDQRLIDAHKTAVDKALQYIQDNAARTRSWDRNRVVLQPTDNLVVAQFNHDTSRDLDPQLHTHNVVLNITQRADGQWRSIESKPIFDMKMLAGALYRAELAYHVKQLGYDIVQTHEDGRFEITSVPENVREGFSKRRAEIKKELERRGRDDAKTAANVAVITRQRKTDVNRSELQGVWQQQSKEMGYDPQKTVAEAMGRSQHIPPLQHEKQRLALAEKAVAFAAAKLAEREAVFSAEGLMREAVLHGFGGITQQDIGQAIKNAEGRKSLIPAEARGEKGWTTPEALALEKAAIDFMKMGKDAVSPIMARSVALDHLATRPLNDGQREAAAANLSTKDRIVGIQGYAGTGKTFMLTAVREMATVREIAEKEGYVVRGFAPGAAQANILQKEAGIASTTLTRHLVDLKKEFADFNSAFLDRLFASPPDHSKELWVVDESSMISNRLMRDLLRAAERTGARVVLVGDIKQLGAVEAGKPFELLQKAGMQVQQMKEILRQKDKDALSAVHLSIAGKAREALDKIRNTVYEIEDKDKRLDAIAKHYLSLSPAERPNTLVIAPANEDRVTLNNLIREGLTQEGKLAGAAAESVIYARRGLTRVEASHAGSYKVDDIVRFGRTYQSLGVEKGEYATVRGTDQEMDVVNLQTNDGRKIVWNPSKVAGRSQNGVEVYRQEEREIKKGDLVRWTRNDNARDIRNAEIAEVTDIKGKNVTFQLSSGKHIALNIDDPQNRHWDHAYTTTVYAAQGRTADHVIVNAEDFRKNLTNQKAFYVEISRARHTSHIYVNDRDGLIKAIEERAGDKTSALESIERGRDREPQAKDGRERGPKQKEHSLTLER